MRSVAPALVCLVLTAAGAFSQTPPGKPAGPRRPPPLSLRRPGQAPLALSELRGKVVALTFISTVCSHCQDFTRAINPIARKYAGQGVQFVECAINDGAEAGVKPFVAQFQPPFPVGWATQEAMASFLGLTFLDLRAMSVPHMVLLDRMGRVREDLEPGSQFYVNPAASVPAALDKLLRQ